MQQESSAAEAKRTSEANEDECSESFQAAVAEGEKQPKLLRDMQCGRNKIRTAPLWGLRLRSRLMHDGNSITVQDAIHRHDREAHEVRERFQRLKPADQTAVLVFLQSL